MYGWIIDVDHFPLGDDPTGDAGMMGPRDIPDNFEILLRKGTAGRRFRMYDADNELLYSGRIIVGPGESQITDDSATEFDFAPLDDFGQGSGATDIYYWQHDIAKWEVSDQEKAREAPEGTYFKIGETFYQAPILTEEGKSGGWVMI